jgi:hypothetical protein
VRGAVSRPYTIRDWRGSFYNLEELLSLTDDELAQLEEKEGDISLVAAWWRRRRRAP